MISNKMKFLLCIFALMGYSSATSISSRGDELKPRLTDNRIVGGEPVNIVRHPHQVSLRYKSFLTPENSYSHRCGGSIQSERVIITAAHCIIGTVASQFQIVGGTNNRRGNDGFISPVQEIIMHEHYDPNTYDNDIAILILGTPLPLNNNTMRAIELTENDLIEGERATVTGWGATTQGGTGSNELQEVKVPIVSNELCNKDYDGMITDSMLCAGVRGVGGKDACQGDSGGPLVVKEKLAGVVSWGFGCAQPQYPGVYAKVSYFRTWLMEKIKEINSP